MHTIIASIQRKHHVPENHYISLTSHTDKFNTYTFKRHQCYSQLATTLKM